MKVVLDTNVLLAAMLAPGLCRELVRKRCRSHALYTSAPLLEELADKLRDKFGFEPGAVPVYVAYSERATRVTPQALPRPVCRDPDDDVVLATASAADADAIVTGDEDLLVLREFQGIRILSPRQSMDM